MKIAINTTSAVAGGGITYIKNLLTHLSKINTTHQYLILTTHAGKELLYFQHPNFTFLPFKLPSINSISRLCWEQLFLPVFLKKMQVDILFSPANVCPLFSNLPNVVMIQNVEPFVATISKNRGFLQSIRLRLLKRLTILSMKKAQRTLFPSTQARVDTEKCGVRIQHAEVVYHGINKELFRPCRDDDKSNQIKRKYGLDKFILSVSHIQRYKNFLELAKAFILLKDRMDNDVRLVFAGRCFDREYYDEMQAFIAKHGYHERIIFLGSIPYEELPYLYSTCKLFVFPSTCESFGMTLVEAMACGAPILASRLEPMPEICADAAVYFDPTNPAAMAEVIFKALNDRELIPVLTKNALERATFFSWENTAKKTFEIIESLA